MGLTTSEGTVPIDAPMKKNHFSLPGKFEGRKKEEEQKLTYSNSVPTKLRSAIDIRPEITKKVFQSELFGVAPSLAETSTKLYHGTKSKISQQFDTSEYINIDPAKPSAVVIELSPTNTYTFIESRNDLRGLCTKSVSTNSTISKRLLPM